jgi:hypothetical protein
MGNTIRPVNYAVRYIGTDVENEEAIFIWNFDRKQEKPSTSRPVHPR